jgi:hypothetical protein
MNRQSVCGALGALVVAGFASSASAGAFIPFVVTFDPIGDAPNVEWTPDAPGSSTGAVRSIGTHGVANMLVHFEDPAYASLGYLPATLSVTGNWMSYKNNAQPYLAVTVALFYASDTPATDGEHTFSRGSFLGGASESLFNYTFDLGYFSDQGLATYLTSDVYPTIAYNSKGRPYVASAGQGQWRGAFLGSAAPEPVTWAVMVMGFAGMGAVLRGRGRGATFSAV